MAANVRKRAIISTAYRGTRIALLIEAMRVFLSAFCLIAISLSGCGTEVHRQLQPPDISFSVQPPQDLEALQVTLKDQITDMGMHQIQLSLSLKNSSDSAGRLWSEMLGGAFFVKSGEQKYQLTLSSEVGDKATYSFAASSLSAADANAFSNQTFSILDAQENLISSLSASLPSLTNFSQSAALLADRILSSCSAIGTTANTQITWSGESMNPISISIGSNPVFTQSVVDNSSWKPGRSFFETFFSKSELDTIDSVGGQTSRLQLPMTLNRTSQQSLRVFKSGHVDRTMAVNFTTELSENIEIQYLNCAP